jgi:small subunit ribosomal protein S12e
MAAPATETPVVAVEPVIVEDKEPEDVEDALRIVVKRSMEANGLIRGLSQVARALDGKTAHLCVLADDCDDAQYVRLIKALCAQNNIDLLQVAEKSKLAEWAGLVKRDATGAIKKTFKCSSVAIRDFGEKTRALEMLLEQLNK